MEREEGGGEEEVVHGVEIDVAQGGEDEHQKEKEEEGNGSEETDFSGERAGLEMFGHGHAELQSGEKVFITPCQVPAGIGLVLFCGRERVLGEVDGFEVGVHVENEIFDLGNAVVGAFAELVVPVVESLGAVGEGYRDRLSGGDVGGRRSASGARGERGRLAVDEDGEVVVDGLGGGEVEGEGYVLGLVAGVTVVVDARETYGVGAEPEQAFLAVVEVERDVDAGAFERERVSDLFCDLAGDGFAVFDAGVGFALFREVGGGWGHLRLGRAPVAGDGAREAAAARGIGTGENGAAEDAPGDGGADKDEGDGGNTFEHEGLRMTSTL